MQYIIIIVHIHTHTHKHTQIYIYILVIIIQNLLLRLCIMYIKNEKILKIFHKKNN
jgi:hypothetical protein